MGLQPFLPFALTAKSFGGENVTGKDRSPRLLLLGQVPSQHPKVTMARDGSCPQRSIPDPLHQLSL